ncbi:hypothetical protein Ddc_11982 [Ditylenchus destructor]|nr:hypothetical protein Ddc_11982 [Ditylenchus destructor]
MDNGTMVESFKFLNYCQLAKNSLASKRFRDVIRTHRHKLALLYVENIGMESYTHHFKPAIRIFGKDLSSEEYNEWIVRNEYSKQIPLECQVAEMESTEDERKFYQLKVNPKLEHETIIFHARTLHTRNDILPLLEKAMNPDRNSLQCDNLCLYLEGNAPKFISWIKDHVRCERVIVLGYSDSNKLNYDRELLDLFMTGANCSSEVIVSWRDSFPKIVDDFVQSAFGRQCLVLGHTGVEYSILWLCQRQLAAFGRSNGGFVSANSRPSAARRGDLVPQWLCQCQLAAFGRSNGGFVSANSQLSPARTVATFPKINCDKIKHP